MNGEIEGRASMNRNSTEIERQRALRQFEVVLALLALMALAIVQVLQGTADVIGLAVEAKSAMTLAFLVLAGIDATLLVVWERLVRLVSQGLSQDR